MGATGFEAWWASPAATEHHGDAGDETAARAAWAAATERAAKVAENGSFIHDDSPAARFGREVAAAIRRGA